jgi:hypothetical protein
MSFETGHSCAFEIGFGLGNDASSDIKLDYSDLNIKVLLYATVPRNQKPTRLELVDCFLTYFSNKQGTHYFKNIERLSKFLSTVHSDTFIKSDSMFIINRMKLHTIDLLHWLI